MLLQSSENYNHQQESQEYIRWLMSLITISSLCDGFMKYYSELSGQSLVYLHNYNHFHFSLSFSLNVFNLKPIKYYSALLLYGIFLNRFILLFWDASQKSHFTKFEQYLYNGFSACINVLHSLYSHILGVGTKITNWDLTSMYHFWPSSLFFLENY